jgi:hypothetical protein
VSSPLQFYHIFRSLLAENGILAVLTSGMACVEYGLQQTTKDTDWIVEISDFPRLLGLLCAKDQEGWKVRHRQLFGAPMLETYMDGGWTCHLAIHDEPGSPEHHLDFFGRPPRLTESDWQPDYGGLLNRPALAQMKKTDRPKDWPFVNAIAIQSMENGGLQGLLHLREPGLLAAHVARLDPADLQALATQRPILAHLENTTEIQRERLLMIEEALWHAVNRERYLTYQRAWKEFYKGWTHANPGVWPNEESFARQHGLLVQAAEDYGLPHSPLAGDGTRHSAYARAIARVIGLTRACDEEITAVLPPLTVMLP